MGADPVDEPVSVDPATEGPGGENGPAWHGPTGEVVADRGDAASDLDGHVFRLELCYFECEGESVPLTEGGHLSRLCLFAHDNNYWHMPHSLSIPEEN